jgi:ankyrin repeat protein
VDGQADAFHLNNQGRNALMEAAAAGHAECIQHLLDHGSADVNVQHEESGSHALLEAAAAGHAGCVVVLLEAGAKVNRVDKAGVSALLAAACAGHLRCVQLLLQYDPKHIAEYTQKRTPLMAAAANGQCAVVAALLKAGADVDGVDGAGKSALQLAGNVRCKVLLEDQQRGKVNLSPQGRASRQLTWRPQDLQPWMISVA